MIGAPAGVSRKERWIPVTTSLRTDNRTAPHRRTRILRPFSRPYLRKTPQTAIPRIARQETIARKSLLKKAHDVRDSSVKPSEAASGTGGGKGVREKI
jgi:hypothetical protein